MDYISMLLGVIGCYAIGDGRRWGWTLYAIASLINACIGWATGYYGLFLSCIFYFILELRGYVKHGKHGKQNEK